MTDDCDLCRMADSFTHAAAQHPVRTWDDDSVEAAWREVCAMRPLASPEDVAKRRASEAYRSLMAKVHYKEVKCPPTP